MFKDKVIVEMSGGVIEKGYKNERKT
jgi:hypothetical protein